MAQRIEVMTKELVLRTVLFGACRDRIPDVGTPISRLSQSDLIWGERILTKKERASLVIPVWCSGDGYGYGSGYGYG